MVRIKICGLTNIADARAAVWAGADLLGFIFYPASRRHVTPATVRAIVSAVRDDQPDVVAVGVFVNEPVETICQVLDYCGLEVAQLHGDEPPAMLGLDADHPSALRGCAYKALRPATIEGAVRLATVYALPETVRGRCMPALLVDTHDATQRGGTGRAGDWTLAARLAAQYPLLLAGGLTPDNVAVAVRAVRPWGVDVATGVECAPGKKDHAALRAFISAARSAD
jgi:phosphoribosylanthranilate isomerase